MNNERLLGTYYFRAGMFTLVPHHIRAQLNEIKEIGTDFVCLAINVDDCGYNAPNIEFLIDEIHKRKMQVYFVPSLTAGITAGAPLNADTAGYHYPHTWTQNRDGTKLLRKIGPLCSFYYPEIEEHFLEEASLMMDKFSPDGIIWDEPKSTNWQDFSPKALEKNPDGDFTQYLKDYTAFFSRINKRLKEKYPKLKIVHFDEACRWDSVVEATVKIQDADYIGVDGRPFKSTMTGVANNSMDCKVLPIYGERYLAGARKEGKQTFALIENQRLTLEELEWFERDIETITNLDVNMMVYYYYGFHQPDVERNMDVIRTHLAKWRKG